MSYVIREPVVMKDAISSGELKVGDWLVLNDGTRSNIMSSYQLVNVDVSSNTAVLMGGVVQTNINWRDSDEVRVYPNGDLDVYLTGTFYNSIPAEYKAILVHKRIAYTNLVQDPKDGWVPRVAYIDRSVFAPSATELAISSEKAMTEGAAFQWFSGNVNAKDRRTRDGATTSISSAYWTRTRNKASALLDTAKNYALYVKTNGDMDTCLKWNAKAVRPCINITMNCIVSRNNDNAWWITPDLPPVFNPGSFAELNTLNDTDVTFTWDAGTDTVEPSTYDFAEKMNVSGSDDDNVWYEISERITYESGNTITSYYNATQNRSFTTRYVYGAKASRADFYIRAVDKWGNYSDWQLYRTIYITNNAPPNKPGAISFNGRYKGERIRLSWEPGYVNGSLDQDNNFAGYKVYRAVDSGTSTLIETLTSGEGSSYIDNDVGQWNTVTYSISAYDDYGAESEKTSVTITLLDRVTASLAVSDQSEIQCSTAVADAPTVETDPPNFDPSDPGGDTGHSITFTLSDTVESHTYSGLISFRDAAQNGISFSHPIENLTLVSGSADITMTFTKKQWQTIPSGTYAIRCDVHDNENSDNAIHLDVYFKKVCNYIYWEMSGADAVVVPGETNVDCYFLNVEMSVPEGNEPTVYVTRNANDADPDWREATYGSGDYEEFDSNQTEGNAFGVLVCIQRDDPDDGEEYYLSSVNGVFGMNMFEKIAAQIAAINARIDDYHPAT